MKSDNLAESYLQSIATEGHVIKHDMKGLETTLDWANFEWQSDGT